MSTIVPVLMYKLWDGKYNLYIRTEDSQGNVNIVKSKTFEVRGKIQTPGTIEFRENNASGEILKTEENKIQTKENVWMKITDQGSDKYGTIETTFKITKDGNTIAVGNKTIEIATLTDEGKYTLTLTSKRVNKAHPELEVENNTTYTIIVDKTSPNVTFERISEDNASEGQIEVTIDDKGNKENEEISKSAQTGVKNDTLRYYWTNGNYTPNKDDFYGPENEYRGIINSTTQTINTLSKATGASNVEYERL